MSFLREIFGPSKDEIWQQLANEIGAEFVEGGVWQGSKVVATVKEWTITLDTYKVSNSKTYTTYTRMRAPYVNKDGFRFTIYRKGFFSEIGKFFGMQDIKIGDVWFDQNFIIQGNDEVKIKQLLENPSIRQLIQAQPSIYFHVSEDKGWFGDKFPEGVDELSFQTFGVIKDMARLKSLYNLFAETLNRLCYMGSAYEDDPNAIAPIEEPIAEAEIEEPIAETVT
jgi:hypothetical protein